MTTSITPRPSLMSRDDIFTPGASFRNDSKVFPSNNGSPSWGTFIDQSLILNPTVLCGCIVCSGSCAHNCVILSIRFSQTDVQCNCLTLLFCLFRLMFHVAVMSMCCVFRRMFHVTLMSLFCFFRLMFHVTAVPYGWQQHWKTVLSNLR